MFNVCLCGIQAGYGHTRDCPYPYYGNYEPEIEKWTKQRNIKQIILKYEPNCPERLIQERIKEYIDSEFMLQEIEDMYTNLEIWEGN